MSTVMGQRERIKLGATVGVFAVVMGAVGVLLVALGGWERPVGVVLFAFGIAGVGQGVAIALGYLTPRGGEDSEDRDGHRK